MPRPSCSSSMASSLTMFSCLTFSRTCNTKLMIGPTRAWSMAACEANYQRIFLRRPRLTSNSLIWTSCGRMWLSWLKVLTATVSPLCLLTPCNPSHVNQWNTFENMHDGKGKIGITKGVKYAVASHYCKTLFCENSDVRGFLWSSWPLHNFLKWHVFRSIPPLTHHEFGKW